MTDIKKTFLILILIVGVIAMTVAFSVLTTTLRISGTASVPSATWNIHFQNWALDTQNTVTVGGVTHQNTANYPTIAVLEDSMSLKPNVTKVDNLNVTLYQPGDYAKYKFQIINEGSIDAELDNFSYHLTCASGKNCSHISYEVLCNDAETGGNNVLILHSKLRKNGGLAYCTLEVKYNDYTNDNVAGNNQIYEKPETNATIDATFIYVQDTENPTPTGDVGGIIPSNPYETTFDDTYKYADAILWRNSNEISSDTLDPSWGVYLRKNTSTNLAETCRVYSGGTVCLINNTNGYSSDFADVISSDTHYDSSNITTSGLKGYSLAKAEEMLTKGASYCTVDSYDVHCYMPIVGYCRVSAFGGVYCGGGGSGCDVHSDSSYDCY